jgi:hypothetical protein
VVERRVATAVAAFGLLAATACGGGGAPTAAQQVASTVKRFELAALGRDGVTYCSLLTDQERAHLLQITSQQVGLGPPCAGTLHSILGGALTGSRQANTQVTAADVTVTGDTATVVLPGDHRRLELTKVGGAWKVSGLPGLYLAG